MASKVKWIAFILYISLYMPESFSTTSEPSSESSYLNSFPTGSTNNASDITNTSILSQTSSPSPEAPTGLQETSHISEDLSTLFPLRTTVLVDHEDLNRDEYSGSRLTLNTASPLESNSTMQLEGSSTMDLATSKERHRQPHVQQPISEDKLSYAKSFSAKKKVSKKPLHLSNKSVTSSIPNLIVQNDTEEYVGSTWQNDSYLGNQTQTTDISDLKLSGVSEINQELDETSDFKKRENNTTRKKEKLNSRTQETLLQSVTSLGQESKVGKNSGATEMSTDAGESVQDEVNGSSATSLLQKSDTKMSESSTDMTFSPNKDKGNADGNNTHILSSDNMLLNSSAYDNVSAPMEESASVRPHPNVSQKSRRRRSSDHSAATDFSGNYLTSSPSDTFSDSLRSLSTTENPNTENVIYHAPVKADNANSSVHDKSDGVTMLEVKNMETQNVSEAYVTTLLSTDLTPVSEQNSPEINSANGILSNFSSAASGLTYLVKEVSDSEFAPASSTEGVSTVFETTVEHNSNGDGKISNISVTKAVTEKASISEDAVTSAVPLCKEDDEIDVESTSEISIKVFPLCEKQEVPKESIFLSSSERSIFENGTPTSISVQNPITEFAVNRSESASEVSHDSTKIPESIHEGLEAGELTENLTVSSKLPSTVTDEVTTEPSQGANSELLNLPADKTTVNKVLDEDMAVHRNESEVIVKTEASGVLNTEAHRNLNDLMEIEFTEVGEKDQSMNEDVITATSEVYKNVDNSENRSSVVHNSEQQSSSKTDSSAIVNHTPHHSLKDPMINSSSTSFDYMADQSEVLPVISNPPSQNISYIEHFTARKQIKSNDDSVSTDTSTISPIANIASPSEKSESRINHKSLAVDVITPSEKSVSTNTQEQNISTSLSDMTVTENYTTLISFEENGSQEVNENSTNTEKKIAGVGVKTTVSVSLNVTNMNSTQMNNTNKNGFNHFMNPVVALINATSSSQKLSGKTETSADANVPDSSKSSSTTSADSSKSTEGTQSPLPKPSTTRSFMIRKPRLRINGESSGSQVSRKPFIVKTPPTRASEVVSPGGMFKRNRTRLGSITSSTTASTTIRASWKPFGGQPMTWRYGFENFTLVPEVETVPTTTEEEVQDTETETVSLPTSSDNDAFRYRYPASIVVKKGINCWSDHYKNKYSQVYKIRARRVRNMLLRLFLETEIASTLAGVEIEGMDCRKSGNVTVDYNLYVSKSGSEIPKDELVSIFNNKLKNSTFDQWVLDPGATAFDGSVKELRNTPAPLTDDVEPPIPQWAIAVIVIGAASLVFIILFGALTVYGRHHMRRRYNGSRLGEDDVDRAIDSREWDEKMASTYENLAADGIYDIDDGGFDSVKRGPYGHARHSKMSRHDSWKSDWTERPRRSRYPTDF